MDDTPTPDDTVELGVFNVSIMPPGTKSMRPGEARRLKATKNWSKTPVVENQHKINEVGWLLELFALLCFDGLCLCSFVSFTLASRRHAK